MRTEALLLLVILGAVPVCALERVTVSQLEQAVVSAQRRSDGDLARRIGELELTQRISPARLSRLEIALPGRKSQDALVILADMAAFLDLPDEDLPALPPPDKATQAQIVSRAVDFVAGSIHRMPDFSATRRISRFEALQVVRGVQNPVITHNQPMRNLGHSHAQVEFRQGAEFVGGQPLTGANNANGLTTWGIFGPLLALVTADVLSGKVGFDHWEPGATGPVAVFRYLVGEPVSHYTVTHCCFPGRTGLPHFYRASPQYHGELAIDPATGAILRLVLKTDLVPSALYQVDPDNDIPLARADVVVEYGVVAISGSTYICPLHSVSLAVSWTRPGNDIVAVDAHGIPLGSTVGSLDRVRYTRLAAMNDIRFDTHHVFRGSMRILAEPPVEVR